MTTTTDKPIAGREGEFNTGDENLDALLEFAFDMGAQKPMNMDCGVWFMENLESLREKIVKPGHVKIPTTVGEAHTMIALGHKFLADRNPQGD